MLKRECINTGLCVECGACAVVCPTEAIALREYPWGRNPELVGKCVDGPCRLCYLPCPAREVPTSKIEERVFGRRRKPTLPEKEIGVIRSAHLGYSPTPEIHGKAVSGGAASALLIHALESGRIDGAVLAGFERQRPWRSTAVLARTREEILACAGSKYQPHPQLLGLKLAAEAGLKKIAITATPCHVNAIRKMQLFDEFHHLTDRVQLVLSNNCAAHWSVHATEFLITNEVGVRLEDVAGLTYRARPFPGMFEVKLKDGSVKQARFVGGLLGMMGRFTPEECRLCIEKVAELSDVVLGDTWHHPKLCPSLLAKQKPTETDDEVTVNARKGINGILVRSEIGQEVLDGAIAAGLLKTYPEPTDERCFFLAVHNGPYGKPVFNGPVIEARRRRGMPVRDYLIETE